MSQQIKVYRSLDFYKSSGPAKSITFDPLTSSTILYILPETDATEYVAFGNATKNMDVKMFGNTSGKYLLWDESADSLKVDGTISPVTTDTCALGTTALMFSDLFIASGGVINFNNGNATITHSTGNLAAVAANGFTFTAATLNASTGRVGKFVGTVAAPNQGDGYGAFEVDITASGTFAGTTNASSTWLNVAASAVPGGNLICVHNDGIYLPTGITASSAVMIIGGRYHYVADDGANPGSLYLWSTNIYSNALTALLHVNAKADLGGSTGAVTTNGWKIPFFNDVSANKVWYVNVYDG